MYSPSYVFVCYDRLVQDLSDQVRAANAPNGVGVLQFLLRLQRQAPVDSREAREVREVLPALIKNISRGSSDRYWRVRLQCAQQMPDFFALISRKLDVQDCAVMFRLLAEDVEPDVRVLAVRGAPATLRFLDGPATANIFCPALLGRAAEREAVKVKVALASVLGILGGRGEDGSSGPVVTQNSQSQASRRASQVSQGSQNSQNSQGVAPDGADAVA